MTNNSVIMTRSCFILCFIAFQISTSFAQQVDGVVVNELMSANSEAVADPAGDFDDWIELYNNSSVPIDLEGYGLSDDINDLGKFRFPTGTSIAANGYLIIWADDDQEQGPLHVQFKLSAEGEAIYLTDPNNEIVDQAIFGEIPTNMAYAREPNGTGNFVIKEHTFGTNNNATSSTQEALPTTVRIFPNPSQDFINIDLSTLQRVQSIQLLDLQGRILVDKIDPGNTLQINISELSSGSYFLKIDDFKASLIQKVD